MAKNKIQRIDQEIAKVREKIAEYQDKLKTLEAQKTEAENLEIVQMVRALRLTPEQLNAMLSGGMFRSVESFGIGGKTSTPIVILDFLSAEYGLPSTIEPRTR